MIDSITPTIAGEPWTLNMVIDALQKVKNNLGHGTTEVKIRVGDFPNFRGIDEIEYRPDNPDAPILIETF